MSSLLLLRHDPTAADSARVWRLCMGRAKLQVRGRLPGAFGFDLAADTYRKARRAGLEPADLVPLALPGSWMVNNKVPSPVFQRWLQPVLRPIWTRLALLLDGDAAAWLARGQGERAQVEADLRVLAQHDLAARGTALPTPDSPAPGTAAGLSKVLALLCPDTVPLLDDAALHFALGAVPRPDTADTPSADVGLFVPMLDWFARAVLANLPALTTLATSYQHAPFSPAQALDRLLWFETWGYRVCRQPTPWAWVADDEREAIVPVPAPGPGAPGARVDLAAVADPRWAAAAREGLAAADAGD
jgi:hypothetical protein